MSRSEPLSDLDSLVWSVERDERLRSTIVAVAVLDGPVDRRALRRRIDRASRIVGRLRQRIVAEAGGVIAPRWEHDAAFCLAFHLRMTTLGGQGTTRDLHDLAAAIAMTPFDRTRPMWEVTHVEGLEGGRDALILKSHHAISDGIGGVELAMQIFDLSEEPDPARAHLPPAPDPVPESHPLASAVGDEARAGLSAARGALATLLEAGADPEHAARRLGEMLGSASRQLRPASTPLSATMVDRSLDIGLDGFTVELESLRKAGRRVEGTINDAFVTAVVLGLSSYHRRHGDSLPSLRLAIPVSRRDAADEGDLGNHWAPGRLEVHLGSRDPDTLMATVRRDMRRLRTEPALELLGPLAGVLRRVPASITTPAVAALVTGIDATASNVPGSPVPLHLLGRRVVELVPFGPLSGAAVNVTLLSHGDHAHVGVNHDRAAVPDGEALGEDLREAFRTVVP